jgi:hypothetical protein
MTANLQNPIFTNETKAREWLEARVWPNGPVCPHCGSTGDDVTALNGKAHRPGLYHRRLPRAVHGHGQNRIRAQQDSVVEMACRSISAHLF